MKQDVSSRVYNFLCIFFFYVASSGARKLNVTFSLFFFFFKKTDKGDWAFICYVVSMYVCWDR